MSPFSKSNNQKLMKRIYYYYFRMHNLTYEETFRLVFLILTFILSFFVVDVFRYRAYLRDNGIPMMGYSSFGIMMFGLVIVHYGKQAINRLCHDFVQKRISAQYSEEFSKMRTKKILKWLFDGVYYTSTTVASYYLFQDEPWYPSGLGGNNFSGIWQDYPNLIDNPYVIPFYMIQTANHLYALIHLAIKKKEVEAKYWEYMLHHTLATCLLIFSSLYNQFRFGVAVLAIHDAADIILSFSRAQNDLKSYKILMAIQYVLLLIVWIYTRLYIFSKVILEAMLDDPMTPHARWGVIYLIVQMCILFGMHLYWTYFMILVGANLIKKGKKYEDVNSYDNKEILKQGRLPNLSN